MEHMHILERCAQRTVRSKTIIVSQGSGGRDMYIILSGSLKVSVLSDEGKEISFVVLRQNDYFGELSLIDGRRRSATVTAIEESKLLVLSYAEYQQLLREHPRTATQLLTRMLVTLSNRLRATDELYQDSVFLDVSERLAKFLLNSSVEGEGDHEGLRLIDVQLSQYELGTLVNASRESVNKQLKEWEAQGTVSVDKGKIILRDLESLRHKAGGQ